MGGVSVVLEETKKSSDDVVDADKVDTEDKEEESVSSK